MPIIKKDEGGLYAVVGGWIARPLNEKGQQLTKFKEGEKVEGRHFRGSPKVGMGKLEGRRNYEEYWRTSTLLKKSHS
jgi:hypothetical protein